MAKKKVEDATINLIINGETANKKLRDLEAAARKVKSELKGMLPGSDEFKKSAESLAKIEAALQKTRVEAGLTASKWEKMKQEIKTTFIGNLGANLATLGLQKITGYFTDAWDSAKKLSDQLADIGRTTGLTKKEVESLNSELSKLDTRTSTSDLREMAIVAGQFGVAKDQIVGFVQAIDQVNIVMGSEFGGNAETVATEMSKLRNIFQDIKSDDIGTDIGFISNAINKLAQEGVATAPVVGDLANRIGGYGIQVGLSTGQVLGLSATLQELNVSAERGGTAVVKILQKMLTDTSTFAEIAGADVKTFEKILNEDLFGAFKMVMEGSKNLGGNSTALAGIIKDLEVQGAGASEVFAKLGSNMGMLEGKVKLANTALSNTDSITNQAKEKQDNLAGSIDKLSKTWDKLIANQGIRNFFSLLVSGGEKVIAILNGMGNGLMYVYDLMTKGSLVAEENLKNKVIESAQEKQKIHEDEMNKRVAGYKNGLIQMTLEEAKHAKELAEIAYKNQWKRINELKAEGKFKEAFIIASMAKEKSLEISAANDVIKVKEDAYKKGLENKKRLTDEEIKLQENQAKEEAKIAIRAQNELQKELDEQFKLQQKHYDDLFKEAQKYWDEKDKLFLEENKKQWDAAKEFYDKEVAAAAELAVVLASNEEERLIAEKDRITNYYNEKLTLVKEGTEQEKLLRAQLRAELDALDRNADQIDLQRVSEAANAVTSVWNSLLNRKYAIASNDLARQNAVNQREKDALKRKLDQNLITQQQYEAQVAALDQDAEIKRRDMMREQAKDEKAFAVFTASIKALLATIEAFLDPTKIPGAIAAGVNAAIIAATPIPEFDQGGFTGSGIGSTYNGKQIAGVVHPNEFVINSAQLKNPFVYNMASQLASDPEAKFIKNSTPIGAGLDPKLIEVLNALNQTLSNGIVSKIRIDEEFTFKLNKELRKQEQLDQKGLF